jgi:predicted N-formylglutamate amidohydrolase
VIEVLGRDGAGAFVLACEHASNEIPAEFENLGLDPALLKEHIAWDPGARTVAAEMARLLDAPLVAPRVSRLVHDCNRPGGSGDAIPARSDVFDIPGNWNLAPGQRQSRARRFYEPFHAMLRATILDRVSAGRAPVLVTVHSFTPVYQGVLRDVELGILHDDDNRFADSMLVIAQQKAEMVVRRNQPYGPADGVTHTLRMHALPLGLLNVMIEIRNDLIREQPAQIRMARRLADYLNGALAGVDLDNRAAERA